MKRLSKPYAILMSLVMTMLFGSLPSGVFAASNSEKFELVILRQDWSDLKLGYSYAQALPILRSANASERLCIISLTDIEWYSWTRQSISLTKEATEKLIQALPVEQDLKKHVRHIARVKKERGWGNMIEPALHLKGFLAILDDEIIYAGIFLEPMSEVAAGYPVIRPGMSGRKALLNLLPVQIPFVAYDPNSEDIAVWNKAIVPEGAGTWAHFPPQMKTQIISIGASKNAMEFRSMIRNEKVREILEQAGKLIP